MRALAVVAMAGLLSISRSALPAPHKTLADFIPPTLNGVAVERMSEAMVPPPDVAAAYLDVRKSNQAININLFRVKDLATSKAMFHGLKPGQTKTSATGRVAFKGFVVRGIRGERTRYLSESKKSEAILLLADKLDVLVSIEPTDNEDEAIELLKQLDIVGLNAFAKTMK